MLRYARKFLDLLSNKDLSGLLWISTSRICICKEDNFHFAGLFCLRHHLAGVHVVSAECVALSPKNNYVSSCNSADQKHAIIYMLLVLSTKHFFLIYLQAIIGTHMLSLCNYRNHKWAWKQCGGKGREHLNALSMVNKSQSQNFQYWPAHKFAIFFYTCSCDWLLEWSLAALIFFKKRCGSLKFRSTYCTAQNCRSGSNEPMISKTLEFRYWKSLVSSIGI